MLPQFIKPEVVVEKAGLADSLSLADIHRASFARGWSTDELSRLLGQDTNTTLMAKRPATTLRKQSKKPKAFIMVRRAADEAEILSLATMPDTRRYGIARALCEAMMRELYHERVKSLFLEVDTTNVSAVTLYKSLGFETVSQRSAYYKDENGKTSAALVMRLNLG